MPKPALSPTHWPFQQADVLLVLRQREHVIEQERLRTSIFFRDVQFPDSDTETADYLPSDTSEDEDDESTDSSEDKLELNVDDQEVQDLLRELEENGLPSNLTSSAQESIVESEFLEQIAALDAAEKEASANYNPDEVVALLTEFYELLINLTHWTGVIQKAPHTDCTVNIDLGRELGYNEDVLKLMQRLPYVSHDNLSERPVVPDSRFYNYTKERDLKRAKKHVGYDQYGAPIDSWILPIVGPVNREGWSIVLDTKLGVVRAYTPMNEPPKQSIEYRCHENAGEEPVLLEYHRAPLVPASKYLRTLIGCYQSLDRIPLMDAYHSDPGFVKDAGQSGLGSYLDNIRDEQTSIVALYRECGWPDDWNRTKFCEKWKELADVLRQRAKDRDGNVIPDDD